MSGLRVQSVGSRAALKCDGYKLKNCQVVYLKWKPDSALKLKPKPDCLQNLSKPDSDLNQILSKPDSDLNLKLKPDSGLEKTEMLRDPSEAVRVERWSRLDRFRANMAHMRQSRQDSDMAFREEPSKLFLLDPEAVVDAARGLGGGGP